MTSPGPGSGSGTSDQTSMSGPPGSWILIACMVPVYPTGVPAGSPCRLLPLWTCYRWACLPAGRADMADWAPSPPLGGGAGRVRLVADGAGLENR